MLKEKEDEIEAVKKIHQVEMDQITIAKSKQLVDYLDRDWGPEIKDHRLSRSKKKIKSGY